jgi:pyrroline-5-carboxylate reductase
VTGGAPWAGGSPKVAVIGGGVMGEALATALAKSGASVRVVEAKSERRDELVDLGLTVADAETAVRGAEVVVLVVKPQDIQSALDLVGPLVEAGALVLSIAAGVRTARIELAVPQARVARAMPNTPARIGMAVTGVCPGASCDEEALAQALALMSSVGVVIRVDESQLDAVTAVSGSGPAYLFYLAEAMISGAERAGLSPQEARAAVVGTLSGAAELLARGGQEPEVLRRQVTSPGGTTEAAIAELDRQGVRGAVDSAIQRAKARAGELAG